MEDQKAEKSSQREFSRGNAVSSIAGNPGGFGVKYIYLLKLVFILNSGIIVTCVL